MKAKKILIVGELNVDLIFNGIEGFPKVGTEIIANTMNFTLGSSSAILASNISAMGVDTSFCGMIGDDDFGDFILKQLHLKKVDTSFINKAEGYKTGITVVMNYDQDRANVTYCGAMDALTINEIPWSRLGPFQHVHLSNYFLQEGIKNEITTIFKSAKDAGLTTSLDLQWDPQNKWDFDYEACLPFVDVFLPNEAEILALTRKKNLEEAVEELKPYINIMAIKLGKKGSRLIAQTKDVVGRPYLNKNYIDAIGAGDSFNAGFLLKYLEGASLEECLKKANLMGSLNTTHAGGTAAFSSKEEIEKQERRILNQQL